MAKKVPVLVEFEPSIAAMIDERIGGPCASGAFGTFGSGRAGWVRRTVYAALGLEEGGTHPYGSLLTKIRMDVISDTERLVVGLYLKGFNTQKVISFLADNNVMPARGRRWHAHHVDSVVQTAVAKSYEWVLSQLEASAV